MKILYVDDTVHNYGSAFLFMGLCDVIGSENITDYPLVPQYHDPSASAWKFLRQVEPNENRGDYDVIILASPRDDAVKTLRSIDWNKTPIVFVDSEDCQRFKFEIIEEFSPVCSFKRNYNLYSEIDPYPDNCYPLPFGSAFPICSRPMAEREIDVFVRWATHNCEMRYVLEEKVKMLELLCHDLTIKLSHHYMDWSDYYENLCNSKVVVTTPGYGSGHPIRLWEGLAAGCCVLALEVPVILPHQLIHGKHFLTFNYGNINHMLKHATHSREQQEICSENGIKAIRDWYTVEHLAQYVLEKIGIHL